MTKSHNAPVLEFDGKEYLINELPERIRMIVSDLDFIERETLRLKTKARVLVAARDVVGRMFSESVNGAGDHDA